MCGWTVSLMKAASDKVKRHLNDRQTHKTDRHTDMIYRLQRGWPCHRLELFS